MDVTTASGLSFGEEHFGAAALGNISRTRRLVSSVNRMIAHPGGTLPDKLNRPADLRGFYRLVNQDAVTHAAVLAPHCARTRNQMRQAQGTVLNLHDTTEIDYTGLTSLSDELGQIGNGSHRGFLCHNSLAVIAQTRAVLGLSNQILYRRPEADRTESRKARREKNDRESRLWTEASQAVGPAPEGRLWVDICDRGCDSFEYLDHKHRQNGHYVIRSRHNRWVLVDNHGETVRRRLHDHARLLPELGRREVEVPARAGQPARTAVVRIAAGLVTVPAPKNKRGEHGNDSLTTWVVFVGEIAPPAGAEPLEWILLTNVAAPTFEEACVRIEWYSMRWIIEELHKGQKTGCGIETLQFTTREAIEPAIAILSVVAVFLLQLRSASRSEETQQRPAMDLVPEGYVRVLSVWRYRVFKEDITVKEFYYALARLGGHQNRKCDGFPGWIVLWRGWTKLQDMMVGAEIAAARKHGKT